MPGQDGPSDGNGYQGECKVCGWLGALHDDAEAAELEAAEHAGYCAASRKRESHAEQG